MRLPSPRDPCGAAPRAAAAFRALALGLGALALACSSSSLLKDLPPPDVEVQFSDAALEPAVAHVPAGGNVVWAQGAATYAGAVFLPASMKDAFTCDDLRPEFKEVSGGYLSQPLGSDTERVGLPCPLKPGTYAYELILFPEDMGGADTATQRLKGTIVVAPGEEAP